MRVAIGSVAFLVLLGWVLVATPVAEAGSGASFATLYLFNGSPDGRYPNGLIRDTAGNLYGTTAAGGSSTNCPWGCGTIFKLDTTGIETVLYSFAGGRDGEIPSALVLDAAGNLYGTTDDGGNSDTCDPLPGCG